MFSFLIVRAKAMIMAVVLADLLSIMCGTGSEVMQRITAPIVGGMSGRCILAG